MMTERVAERNWFPAENAFVDLSGVEQLTDGRARCTAVAVCDGEGFPLRTFLQGQRAHFFYEFEIFDTIGVPSGGLEFHDGDGTVVHGKNTFQTGTEAPEGITGGVRISYHHVIKLDVAPGKYWITVGLGSVEPQAYREYTQGSMSHREFSGVTAEHCRAVDAATFDVDFAPDKKLLHYGIANLPGGITSSVELAAQFRPSQAVTVSQDPGTGHHTIFHVTHWKAGSQWIHRILLHCAPDLIVSPEIGNVQFLFWPMKPGRIYPTVYVTKDQFESVRVPDNARRFVIIRDLRDTLVSAYFSVKVSHRIVKYSNMQTMRKDLNMLSVDKGLLYLMEEWLPACAKIQMSWLEGGERLIRYEDLLDNDLEILERVLIDECGLPVSREALREAIAANRFESLTKGRKRGKEDIQAHERKGISGDWRNYFSDEVKDAFKYRYGGLLVGTGYEKDLNW